MNEDVERAIVGPATAPVGFARHVVACLAAAAIGATGFVALFLVQVASAGQVGFALAVMPVTWVGAFVLVLIAGGFWLSLVWPVTRRRGSAGGLIAPIAVAAGAVAMNGGTALAVGHPARALDLLVFAVLGAVTGFGYWWVARRV